MPSAPAAEARSYFFVRHAQAAHQRLFRRGTGGAHPLTSRGRRQARRAAPILANAGVTRVVSSTLLRARQTAALFERGAGLRYEDTWPELDEISPQLFRDAAAPRVPEWWAGITGAWRLHRHLDGGLPGTRAMDDVRALILGVLARLDALPDARVAVVTHGYWMLLMALIVPGNLRLRPIANCDVTRVDADRGHYRLHGFAQPIRGHPSRPPRREPLEQPG